MPCKNQDELIMSTPFPLSKALVKCRVGRYYDITVNERYYCTLLKNKVFDKHPFSLQGAIRRRLSSPVGVCIAPHGCFITPEYIAGRKASIQLASYCCIDMIIRINITIHE